MTHFTFAHRASLLLLVAAFLVTGSLAIANGSGDKGGSAWSFIMSEDSDDPMLPGINPLDVQGHIVSAGSSTVFPLSERLVERFKDEGYADNISVDSIGSGAGFERFCSSGETDVSNASRPIEDKEVANCLAIGREPIEIRVGTDALAVVVSKANTFADNVSMEQLNALFSTAANWSDVNPHWPNEPIQRFIPGTDSGTFDYFVEEVFDKDQVPILSAANLQMSEDDNILVQGVLGSPYSVGFFGYAYYSENADKLNVLNIDGVEASGGERRRCLLPAGPPAVHLHHRRPHDGEAASGRVRRLLPDLRQRGSVRRGILPGQPSGARRRQAGLAGRRRRRQLLVASAGPEPIQQRPLRGRPLRRPAAGLFVHFVQARNSRRLLRCSAYWCCAPATRAGRRCCTATWRRTGRLKWRPPASTRTASTPARWPRWRRWASTSRATPPTTSTSTARSRSTWWSRCATTPASAARYCPVLPGAQRQLHRSFPDPARATGTADEIRTAFRRTRDQLAAFAADLRTDLTAQRPAPD